MHPYSTVRLPSHHIVCPCVLTNPSILCHVSLNLLYLLSAFTWDALRHPIFTLLFEATPSGTNETNETSETHESCLPSTTQEEPLEVIDLADEVIYNSSVASALRRDGWGHQSRCASLCSFLPFLSTACHSHTNNDEENREEAEGHAAL